MASILKNILSFTGLTIGVPASLPHLLNVNSLALKPSLIAPSPIGYTITASSTMITVTRGADDAADVDVYVELWHSYEDAEPTGGIPTKPFIFTGGAGGSGPSAPTTEHVTFAGNGNLGAVDVSFVGPLASQETPATYALTLPDGTIDGQERVVSCRAGLNITWQIIQGGSEAAVTGSDGDYLSAIFVWDDTLGYWAPTAILGGTVT